MASLRDLEDKIKNLFNQSVSAASNIGHNIGNAVNNEVHALPKQINDIGSSVGNQKLFNLPQIPFAPKLNSPTLKQTSQLFDPTGQNSITTPFLSGRIQDIPKNFQRNTHALAQNLRSGDTQTMVNMLPIGGIENASKKVIGQTQSLPKKLIDEATAMKNRILSPKSSLQETLIPKGSQQIPENATSLKRFSSYDPDAYKGIHPDNIVHFNQGANARVTLVVSSADKEMIQAAKAIRSRKSASYMINQLKNKGLSHSDAVQKILDTADSYKQLARRNAHPTQDTLLNTMVNSHNRNGRMNTMVGQNQTGGIRVKTEVATPPKVNIQAQSRLQLPPTLFADSPKRYSVKPLPSQDKILPEINGGKQRGFTTSVQEAPKVLPNTKSKVTGVYTPKPNIQLMGEAQALLQDGAKLDFKNVQNADQKVAATIQEAINQQKKNPQLAANLFNNLSEQGTELGRGVQAFSLLNKMSPEAIALSAAGKIKAYNRNATRKIPELSGAQVKLISDRVVSISKLKAGSRDHNIAVNELSKTINEFIPSTVADKAITVWKAGLLTSLRTHERNILGNTMMAGSEIAKDAIASPFDRLMALKTGKRALTFNLQGTGSGVKKGLIAAKDIVQRGYDPEQTIAKFDQKSITWGNNPLEQALKKGTNVVFRTLGGEDKPFLHGATARSLYDQAKVEAINAGKQGDGSFIQKIISNPTEQMIKQAEKDANYATFHDKNILSGIASAIKRAAQNPKYGAFGELGKVATEVIAPFTGVPSSIAGKTIDYSPIGLAKGAINVSRVLSGQVPELQRQAAQEIGRGVIGAGLYGLGAYLVSKGLMTGQPKDVTEANLWAAQGKQANSVLIGGQWRSINSVGPQSLVMLAGGKYQEEMGKPDGSIGAYAGALGKDQLSQTFLAGVQGPLNAITDPARYGQSYVGNQLSSTIPNIIKDTSKALDPSQRENNTIQDYFTNSVPLLRNQNIEKRDVLGNIMPQQPSGLGAFVDLFNSKTPIHNTVVDELGRLNDVGQGATPGKLKNSQTINGEKTKLTSQQLNILESNVGPQTKQAIEQLISTPEYQSLQDQDKASAIDAVVSQVRKQVRGNIDISGASSGGVDQQVATGQQYTLVDDKGNIKRIDLSKEIKKPLLTGNSALDKKLTSKYNGELTARGNDIVALYQAGKITAEEAGTQLDNLIASKAGGSSKKPAKITIKKVSPKKISFSKFSRKKTPTIKLSKAPVKTQHTKKSSVKLGVPSQQVSYKIIGPSQVKGLTSGVRLA